MSEYIVNRERAGRLALWSAGVLVAWYVGVFVIALTPTGANIPTWGYVAMQAVGPIVAIGLLAGGAAYAFFDALWEKGADAVSEALFGWVKASFACLSVWAVALVAAPKGAVMVLGVVGCLMTGALSAVMVAYMYSCSCAQHEQDVLDEYGHACPYS